MSGSCRGATCNECNRSRAESPRWECHRLDVVRESDDRSGDTTGELFDVVDDVPLELRTCTLGRPRVRQRYHCAGAVDAADVRLVDDRVIEVGVEVSLLGV